MSINPDPTHIKVLAGGKVKLDPNGFSNFFPAQDTINLQWVFNNYPRAEISLAKGTFHISETIEAPNFQGTIKGKGVTKTFLTGRGPLQGEDYVFPLLSQCTLNADLQLRLYPTDVPSLIWFHAISDGDVNHWKENGTEVILRDFTIGLDGVGPLISYYDQPFRSIWFDIITTGYIGNLASKLPSNDEVSHTKITAKNVNFVAKRTPYVLNGVTYTNANTAAAMISYGGEYWSLLGGLNGYYDDQHSPINQQVLIEECLFSGFHQFGTGFEGSFTAPPSPPQTITYQFPTSPVFPQSSIILRNNTYDSIGDGAGLIGSLGQNVIVLANMGTDFKVTGNKFLNIQNVGVAFASGVAETLPTATSTFEISDNVFEQAHTTVEGSSVIMLDANFYLQQPYILNVEDNKFVGLNGYNGNFVELAIGTAATVTGNKFKGYYQHAVTAGNYEQGVTLPYFGANITNNKFESNGVNVVLGEGSNSCYVEVQKASDIENAGTNNTIVIEDGATCNHYTGPKCKSKYLKEH